MTWLLTLCSPMLICWGNSLPISYSYHIDGLVLERRNSIASALELCLSCTNPSIWNFNMAVEALSISRFIWMCSSWAWYCSSKWEYSRMSSWYITNALWYKKCDTLVLCWARDRYFCRRWWGTREMESSLLQLIYEYICYDKCQTRLPSGYTVWTLFQYKDCLSRLGFPL